MQTFEQKYLVKGKSACEHLNLFQGLYMADLVNIKHQRLQRVQMPFGDKSVEIVLRGHKACDKR